MKAMILAAGRGTRMKPLTDSKPKALLEVEGIPLIEHTILYLKYFGISEMIVNVHHHARQLIDFLQLMHQKHQVDLTISDETDALLDTGGGLKKAGWFFGDGMPFLLTACDVVTDLYLDAMIEQHMRSRPLATLAVKNRPSTRDFLFDSHNQLCGWRNNVTGEERFAWDVKHPRAFAFSTVHVIEPELFEWMTEEGSFTITDVYLRLASKHKIMGFEHQHAEWLEFGRIQNLRDPERLRLVKMIYAKYH